ncbi:MAG: BatD family protein, partial [Phycisphaerae bacterium]
TFGIRKVEIGGRIFNMDLLRDVLDQRASQLSVFADGRVRRTETWLTDSNGGRHRYEVFRVTKEVRAEEVGDALVGPVFLKVNYPTAVRRGFFGSTEVTRVRKETARAEVITIEVKAPPEEGRPADYTGAIGKFTIKVSAKPTHVEQGQPVTLTIAIEGVPLEGVAGPDLTRQPELASRFDYTKDELVGDVERGAKVFRRAIFPKQAGEQTVPPISWSFFDPRQEQYISLASDTINITVDPPSARTTTIVLSDKPDNKPKGTTLTVLTGGISPNFVDAEDVLADQSFALTLPWIASLIASPLAWLVVTATRRHRARLKADVGFARRRRAQREAHARIKLALRNGEAAEQLHGLAKAMTGYLADRFGPEPGTLTPSDVQSLLSANGIEEAMVTQIEDFLERCDASRFAPGTMGALSPSQAATTLRGWIKRIERGTR